MEIELAATWIIATLAGIILIGPASGSSQVDRALDGYEASLESLATQIRTKYDALCTARIEGPTSCVVLACTGILPNAVCTNNTRYGNLVGMGCANCTGRQLSNSSSSVEVFPNSTMANISRDIVWTSGIDFDLQLQPDSEVGLLNANSTDLLWQHVTTEATGVTRTFPGRLVNSSACNSDSRLRSRYASVLAGVKDVVIVMDNRDLSTRPAVVNAVANTLDTLNAFDRVGLVTYSNRAVFRETGRGKVLASATESEIQITKLTLREIIPDSQSAIADYTAAFQEGLTHLDAVTGGHSCLRRRVLIFISQSADRNDNPDDIGRLVNNSVSSYGTIILSYSVTVDSVLDEIADQFGGVQTTIGSGSMEQAVPSYFRLLWALSAEKYPNHVFWSGSQLDGPSKQPYYTVSRPVFRTGCQASLSSLIGVVAIDVPGKQLEALQLGGASELRGLLMERSANYCRTAAKSCSVWNALPSDRLPYLPSSIFSDVMVSLAESASVCRNTSLSCHCPVVLNDLSRPEYCRTRSRPTPTCCKPPGSSTCSSDSDSSGLSTSSIVSIVIWSVIILAYPVLAMLGKMCDRCSNSSCSRPRRRRRPVARPARPNVSGQNNRPGNRRQSSVSVEEDPEDYTNRELTNAPPPSYDIALVTTTAVVSSNPSITVLSDSEDEPPPAFEDLAPPGEAELPPPSYDELATSGGIMATDAV